MAQEHRRKCKSPLFTYCSPISLKFHLIWSNLGDLVYTLRLSEGHKIPCTDRLCALLVHCGAMTELCLSQVSDPAPGNRSAASRWCRAAWGLLQSGRAACALLMMRTWLTGRLIHEPSFSMALVRKPGARLCVWQLCESSKKWWKARFFLTQYCPDKL